MSKKGDNERPMEPEPIAMEERLGAMVDHGGRDILIVALSAIEDETKITWGGVYTKERVDTLRCLLPATEDETDHDGARLHEALVRAFGAIPRPHWDATLGRIEALVKGLAEHDPLAQRVVYKREAFEERFSAKGRDGIRARILSPEPDQCAEDVAKRWAGVALPCDVIKGPTHGTPYPMIRATRAAVEVLEAHGHDPQYLPLLDVTADCPQECRIAEDALKATQHVVDGFTMGADQLDGHLPESYDRDAVVLLIERAFEAGRFAGMAELPWWSRESIPLGKGQMIDNLKRELKQMRWQTAALEQYAGIRVQAPALSHGDAAGQVHTLLLDTPGIDPPELDTLSRFLGPYKDRFQKVCAADDCDNPVPPSKTGGRPKDFCCDACRRRQYKPTHRKRQ